MFFGYSIIKKQKNPLRCHIKTLKFLSTDEMTRALEKSKTKKVWASM